MTPGQRRRRRRDLVLYAVWRRGPFSQRFLADVLDMAPSRVGRAVVALRAREGAETGRDHNAVDSDAYRAWLAASLAKTARPRTRKGRRGRSATPGPAAPESERPQA